MLDKIHKEKEKRIENIVICSVSVFSTILSDLKKIHTHTHIHDKALRKIFFFLVVVLVVCLAFTLLFSGRDQDLRHIKIQFAILYFCKFRCNKGTQTKSTNTEFLFYIKIIS